MIITAKKIKLFGKVETMYQVCDSSGEVLQVFCSQEEANEWIQKNG